MRTKQYKSTDTLRFEVRHAGETTFSAPATLAGLADAYPLGARTHSGLCIVGDRLGSVWVESIGHGRRVLRANGVRA